MSNWIDVSDRLPEPSTKILLYWRPIDHIERDFHKEIMVGELSYNSTTKVWLNGRDYDIETHITHWQPLPEPPK